MKKFLSALLIIIMLLSTCVLLSCETDKGDDKDDNSSSSSSSRGEKTFEEELLAIDNDKERAQRISNYSDDVCDGYSSYKLEMTILMVMNVQGTTAEMVGTMEEIRSDIGTDNFFYYTKDDMTVSVGGTKISTQSSTEFYKDGKHYINRGGADGMTQKLCASMSVSDFMAYLEKDESNFDENDCTTVTCVLNDDKTWTVHYEGYTKSAIKIQLEELGIGEDELGADILDIKYTYKVDKDMNLISGKIEFVFDAEGEDAPVLESEVERTGINSTKAKSVNTTDYTEVDSIVIIDEFEKKLEKIQDDVDGKFTLYIEQALSKGSQKQTNVETDEVSYGVRGGKYFYNAIADMGSAVYNVKYENGYQTITSGAQSQKNAQTEQEAKDFVNNLINTCRYNADSITGVTKNSDGSYDLITTNPDYSMAKALLTSWSAEVTYKGQIVTVKFADDGSIESVESVLTIKGNCSNGDKCQIVLKSVLTIK